LRLSDVTEPKIQKLKKQVILFPFLQYFRLYFSERFMPISHLKVLISVYSLSDFHFARIPTFREKLTTVHFERVAVWRIKAMQYGKYIADDLINGESLVLVALLFVPRLFKSVCCFE
jgi:hypothetical protein